MSFTYSVDLSQASIADALRRIDAHGQRFLSVGQIDPRRVPDEDRRGAPGDVAGVVHVEVPGQRAALFRTAGRIGDFGGGADQDGLVAVAGLLEAVDFGLGEHLFRVHSSPEPATIMSDGTVT